MKTQNQGMQFSLACLLLVLGVGWGSPAWPAPPSNKPGGGPPGQATTTSGTSTATSGVMYSGRAFGAFVNVNLLGLVVGPETLSDTGPLPPSGGLQTNQLETVSIPGVLSATLMSTMTSGANGVARSEASLADLSVLPGSAAAVTASFVRAESEATCSGVRGATEVADVTFAGQSIAVDPFAPNQTFTIPPNPIGVPPVATLIINRSEEHTSELQSPYDLVCRLLLEKQ